MKVKSLAVLSMAAVSFLVGCNNTNANDKKFVDNINKVIESNKSSINTVSDAAGLLTKAGYSIETKLSKSNYELAFDIDKKCFIGMNGDQVIVSPSGYSKNSNTYHIFKVTDCYSSRSCYSQYLTSKFEGATTLVATTGLDTGSNYNIKNISYLNQTSTKKDILLNVNCDYLTIGSPLDDIKSYGEANNIHLTEGYSGTMHQYGKASYIQTNGGTIYLEKDSSTDVFEIPEGKTANAYSAEGAYILAKLNAPDVESKSVVKLKTITEEDLEDVTDVKKLQDILDDTNYNFFRLNTEAKDIVIKDNYITLNRNIFFDLNGRSITFLHGADVEIPYSSELGATEKYKTGILVTGDDGTNTWDVNAFLMDTKSRLLPRSGINLGDCSLLIKGNDDKSGTKTNVKFYMNSGKIHDIRGIEGTTKETKVNTPAVLLTGNIIVNDADRQPQNCEFNMYGGYIKSEEGANWTECQIANKCIQPRGKGAVVNMMYGDLESFYYCISGQGTQHTTDPDPLLDKYGDVEINIYGGNITGGLRADVGSTDYDYTPLFFPYKCEVNIYGGNINAPKSTCMHIIAGTYEIDGANFYAGGKYNDKPTGWASGSKADGSVVYIQSNSYYDGGKINPVDMTINNTTMKSANGNAFTFVGYNDKGTPYTNEKLTINGGSFTYNKAAHDIYIQDEIESNITVNKNGGTWIAA